MGHQNPDALRSPMNPDKKVLGFRIHPLGFWRLRVRGIQLVTLGKEEASLRIQASYHGIEKKNALLVGSTIDMLQGPPPPMAKPGFAVANSIAIRLISEALTPLTLSAFLGVKGAEVS